MGVRRRSGRGWHLGIEKLLAGAGLISVGICLGVVLGSVLDGPRLFVRRLSQGVQRVEIQTSPSNLDLESLTAFRELQREGPVPSPPSQQPALKPPPAALPAPVPKQRLAKKQPLASVAAARNPRAAKREPPSPSPEPRLQEAERVISEIAAREASRQQAGSGKVVQVAAYTERRMAEALVQRLREDEFGAYLSDRRSESKHRYRVRVRTQKGQSPQALASSLKERGLSVWITTE